MPNRLHLVDGTYELFRAHFGRRPDHRDRDGGPAKATVGVLRSLLALIGDEDEQVTHLGIAFDNPIESFRNDMFDGYKTGAGIEPELRSQFDLVERACRVLGVHTWTCVDVEADDVLAAAAVQLADRFTQVRIMTPDKDLAQVVSGTHVVQVDRMRDREFDADGVVERLGVSPASVPDYLALVGDTADGIPGLKGFGAKSTGTLLSHYRTLEAVPALGERWEVTVRGAQKLAGTLAAQMPDALLYRELARLRLDAPIDVDVDGLAFRGTDRDAWLELCDELADDRLAARDLMWREA